MNKQLLEGANSIGSLQETGRHATVLAKSKFSPLVVLKKYKVLFLVAGVLFALAAVPTAVGVSQSLRAQSEQHKKSTGDSLTHLATKEELLKQVILLYNTYSLHEIRRISGDLHKPIN